MLISYVASSHQTRISVTNRFLESDTVLEQVMEYLADRDLDHLLWIGLGLSISIQAFRL